MRKMKWLISVLLLLCASQAWGQVPNLEAHRLYFVAITSAMDKDVDTAALSMRVHLNAAGVAESEHGAAFKALAQFKSRYAALTSAYNNSPSTLAGNNDDTASFLAMRDLLVQQTIELLQASLSKKSFSNFEQLKGFEILKASSAPVAIHRHGTKLMPVQNGMTPHYSTARTQAVGVNSSSGDYTLYDTVVVDGYTTCSYCPYTHQGSVENTLNGGGTVYGPRVSPPSNISVTNQQSWTVLNNCFNYTFPEVCNEDYNYEESSNVECTGIGSSIFGWGKYMFVVEAAITFSQVTGWLNASTATLQDWCQLPYEPPDYNPYLLLNAQADSQYSVGGALCVNSTLNARTWKCSPGIAYSLTGTYTRKPCTHNIPPY